MKQWHGILPGDTGHTPILYTHHILQRRMRQMANVVFWVFMSNWVAIVREAPFVR